MGEAAFAAAEAAGRALAYEQAMSVRSGTPFASRPQGMVRLNFCLAAKGGHDEHRQSVDR
jgi:hypothetical protein